MTPKEALNLLDNICSQVQLSREMHVKVQEAVAVLTAAIEEKSD